MSDVLTLAGIPVLAAALAVIALAGSNLRLFRPAPAPLSDPPSVSILIPARDEAATIEAAVRGAFDQVVPLREVLVLDDNSTDETGLILIGLARQHPGLQVLRGAPLPSGWAGKAWACWQLARQARGEWLLFVDCDVALAPDAARRALAAARAQSADFASAFPRLVTRSVGEALLVPLVHLVLLTYLPMALIRRVPVPTLSAACGQFMLVRREAYFAADGHRAAPGTLHDGIMLARRMKATGHAIAVFDGADIAACRMYEGFRATWRGFARNAYEALGSPGALAAMIALNLALFVAPFGALAAAILSGNVWAAAIWGAAAATVLAHRARLAVRFGHPWWTVPATPVAVALMVGIQVHSFVNHITRRPVVWRARAYPGAERARKA